MFTVVAQAELVATGGELPEIPRARGSTILTEKAKRPVLLQSKFRGPVDQNRLTGCGQRHRLVSRQHRLSPLIPNVLAAERAQSHGREAVRKLQR